MTQRLYSRELELGGLLAEAEKLLPGFRLSYISLPSSPTAGITLYGEVDGVNPLLSEYASSVRFDPSTGDYLSHRDAREMALTDKIISSFRKLHFGYFAGLYSRTFWSIVGVMPLFLAITGVSCWWIRRKGRRPERERSVSE